MKYDLGGDVGLDFWIFIEANIVWPTTAVKDLQRNLPRELVRTRQSHNSENPFFDLPLNCRVQWYARTQHQDIHPKASIAEGILHMEDEVTVNFFKNQNLHFRDVSRGSPGHWQVRITVVCAAAPGARSPIPSVSSIW